MPALFASTLFLSATLLFLLQPMIAKMLLPKFGGAPAVWNTCMVFFQTALLAGYAYAHAATLWLGVRRQAKLHLVLLLLPLTVFPISIAESWKLSPGGNPIPPLLGLLALVVGLPFFVVSTSAPLLQKWFASTGQPGADDPYYLYVASNLGSMAALLGYPLLLEPFLTLQTQASLWAAGYGLLIVLTAACAVALVRAPVPVKGRAKKAAAEPPSTRLPWRTRLHWMVLALVPSSLMLGATTYLTTDLSPFPLLWIIPLALYLLSFILVFSRLPAWVQRFMVRLLPVVILAQFLTMATRLVNSIGMLLLIHLLTLFVVAMVCHGELARTRPATRHLTEFYLWISIGGALGGFLNALVAPLIFSSLLEYPLALVLACFLVPTSSAATPSSWQQRALDFALPLLVGILGLRLLVQWEEQSATAFIQGVGQFTGLGQGAPDTWKVRALLAWTVPVVICYFFARRPLRFGLGVAMLFLADFIQMSSHNTNVFQERNFFGVLRITSDNEGRVARLTHGTTLHGAQIRSDNPQIRLFPLTYYFPTGPVGQYFDALAKMGPPRPIAAIGLGTGTLATFILPGQEITFFDIDPTVVRVAQDQDYFTYITECKGKVRIELGDARLQMAEEPDGYYGMIIVDAFNSDAIPVHLITREAIQLYLRKLADDGLLVVHISNMHLDLETVMANVARADNLLCLSQMESRLPISEFEARKGKILSDWVILARHEKDFGPLLKDPRWRRLTGKPGGTVWTDDFSNIVGVIKWRQD